jgi:hypothetical protein
MEDKTPSGASLSFAARLDDNDALMAEYGEQDKEAPELCRREAKSRLRSTRGRGRGRGRWRKGDLRAVEAKESIELSTEAASLFAARLANPASLFAEYGEQDIEAPAKCKKNARAALKQNKRRGARRGR